MAPAHIVGPMVWLVLLPVLAALVAVVVGRRAAARFERETNARLKVGPDGVIPGAGPIDLEAPAAAPGVLLLHGFGDTPQTLRYLAVELHQRGYAVLCPLLPGHGRTLRAFAVSRADDWAGAAAAALRTLQERHSDVGLVGLSMGGALAASLAADHPELFALVLLAPYLEVQPAFRRAARLHALLGIAAPYMSGAQGHGESIHDASERALSLGYGGTTPELLSQLVIASDRGKSALHRITIPTLIVQSRIDNRIMPEVALRSLDAVGAAEKRLEWVTGAGHVITVDYGRDQVAAMTAQWLDAHRKRSAG